MEKQITPIPEHKPLWDHQREAVKKAIQGDYYALFFQMGAGKTGTAIEILRNIYWRHRRVLRTLILCPPVVITNWYREFGVFSKCQPHVRTLAGTGAKRLKYFEQAIADDPNKIFVTNYESITTVKKLAQAIGLWRPEVLILDECFDGSTLVDTPQGRRPISDIRVGDYVYNALGISQVKSTIVRTKHGKVVLEYGGEKIVCSLNHPFLTETRGWVEAQYLYKGEKLVKTTSSMRILQREYCTQERKSFLFKELFREIHGSAEKNISEIDRCFSETKQVTRMATRQEEGRKIETIRLDSIEVYKPRNIKPEDENTFYDLTIEGHPSFSVNGALVHNSHRCKTHNSRRTKAAIKLADAASYRFLLTGTPILNGHQDIWSQFRILDGGKAFGESFYKFKLRYFFDKNEGFKHKNNYFPNWQPRSGIEREFNKKIYQVATRVLKKDCLDLPPFVRTTIPVELTPAQKSAYKQMYDNFIAYIEGKACIAQIAVTKALRLQQIVTGFYVDDQEQIHEFDQAPRLQALKELLEDITPGAKVIVWACFKQNYKSIRGLLDDMGIEYCWITGGMNDKDRQKSVDRIKYDKRCRVILCNQQAAGEGVNLTSCSYAIYYSRNFSLGADEQSEARCYRGGSEIHNKVTRIDLVTPGTIDEQVIDALRTKKKVSEHILQVSRKKLLA